jgi:hypothetical protein
MISEISPIVNFVTILKTVWCLISCIGFTEIQLSRNMSKYIPLCYQIHGKIIPEQPATRRNNMQVQSTY